MAFLLRLGMSALITALILATPLGGQSQSSVTYLRGFDPGDSLLFPRDMIETGLGKVMVAGEEQHTGTDAYGFVSRYHADGSLQWFREYHSGIGSQRAMGIVEKNPNEFVILMAMPGDSLTSLLTIDSGGVVLAEVTFRAPLQKFEATDLLATTDGGFLIGGQIENSGSDLDMALIKTDSNGIHQWAFSYPGLQSGSAGYGGVTRVVKAADNSGYYVLGTHENLSALLKVDNSGAKVFHRTYLINAPGVLTSQSLNLLQKPSGDMVLFSNFFTPGSQVNLLPVLLPLDSLGNPISTNAISVDMASTDMVLTADGGMAIAGFRKVPQGVDRIVWARFDENLNFLWGKRYPVVLALAQFYFPATIGLEMADGGLNMAAEVRFSKSLTLQKTDSAGEIFNCGYSNIGAPYNLTMLASITTMNISTMPIITQASNFTTDPVGLSDYIGCAPAPGLKPDAEFISDFTSIPAGGTVNFEDISLHVPTSWSWSFPGGIPSSSTLQDPANILYSNAGIYDVTLIATNGLGSDTITKVGYIEVGQPIQPPIADFTASDTVIQLPGAPLVNFTDLSTNNPMNWEWTFTGATPSQSVFQNPPGIDYNITSGCYDVKLKVWNQGGADSLTKSCFIQVLDPVGISTYEAEPRVELYPNPATHHLQLRSAVPIATIAMTDITGRRVMTVPVNATRAEWEVQHLAAGIYWVTWTLEQGTSGVEKVVVQKD